MMKVMFVDAEGENPDSVILNNLKIADKMLNLQLFSTVAFGWLKTRPGSSFQDLEKFLRENKLNTFIIAASPQSRYSFKNAIKHPDGASECKFEVVFSCRPPPFAFQELLEHSHTYEENFDKLKYAGSIFIDRDKSQEELGGRGEMYMFSQRERDLGINLMNAKVKLVEAGDSFN